MIILFHWERWSALSAASLNEVFLQYWFFFSINQASEACMEWVMKKRKAFDKRGDMAVAAWAEQQQRELTLRARNLSRSKVTFLSILHGVHIMLPSCFLFWITCTMVHFKLLDPGWPGGGKKINCQGKEGIHGILQHNSKTTYPCTRKRDLMRKREAEDKNNKISRLLAAEGLELDTWW